MNRFSLCLRLAGILAVGLFLLAPPSAQAVDPGEGGDEPAKLTIAGYGLLGNLRIKRTILALEDNGEKQPFFTASSLEDAALIILSRVGQDGFLRATVDAEIERMDGSTLTHEFSDDVFEPLPRPTQARRVVFRINKGLRYYFSVIAFEGLTAIPEKKAVGFFRVTGLLYSSAKDRLYTPAQLQQGLFSLTETLRREGYRDASANASDMTIDHETGGVSVVIGVNQGLRSRIDSLDLEIRSPEKPAPVVNLPVLGPDQPYSDLYLQDVGLQVRRQLYRSGFAAMDMNWRIEPTGQESSERLVGALGEVETGPIISLRDVRFEGLVRTRLSTVKRQTRLQIGAPLDPLELEDARQRLRRLGVFQSVHYVQVPVDETDRDVVFMFEEGKEMDISLMFGYGSYVEFRGGFEIRHYNLFGRAHQSRLRFVQSVKSTDGEFSYTVPEIYGANVNAIASVYGLRREEISFTRLEAGASVGLRRFFESIDTDFAVSYNYDFLGTEDNEIDPDEPDVTAAAIRLEVTHDKRDNPLTPTKGYRIYVGNETSSDLLGATVNYERFNFAFSWHKPIRDGLLFNFGFKHGFVFRFGSEDVPVPVNKLFFPGGENTVRGYLEGEAAPRDAEGVVVGAETAYVINLELEQAVSTQLSLVGFFDAGLTAARIENYPFDLELYSIGLGLRYNTVIGPIRLEYGYNLNPRPLDPTGTLHFSIGFPF